MARVLVVDDGQSLSDALSVMLYGAGYEVSATGQGALDDFDRDDADIVLLDVVLPGVSGAEVWRRLRTRPLAPVVLIAGQDGEVRSLVESPAGSAGTPLNGDLIAGIQELINQQGPPAGEPPTTILAGGPVRMDLDRHVVSVNGVPVAVPLKEFQLLELLLRNAGRVLTRSQLIAQVWSPDYVGDTKTLDVHVKRLRAKIEPMPSQPRHILNVRSLGFKFEP